jgi:hypothetical protein
MGINPIIIIISIWSGTIIFFSAVVAPTVFKSLDEREAGVFLRAFFPKYYIFGIVLGVISISDDRFNYSGKNVYTNYKQSKRHT